MTVSDNKRMDYSRFDWRGECNSCQIKDMPILNLSQEEKDKRLSALISISCINQADVDAEVRYWESRSIKVEAELDNRSEKLTAIRAEHCKLMRQSTPQSIARRAAI